LRSKLAGGASAALYDVCGAADLNGDGAADVLFRRKTDGVVLAWLTSGGSPPTVTGIVRLASASYSRWQLAGGAGDLNGDGKSDLVWRGLGPDLRAYLWFTSGAVVVGTQVLGTMPINWSLVAAGDYSGDGRDNLVWRDAANGQNLLWKMAGTVLTATQALEPKIGANWIIVGPK